MEPTLILTNSLRSNQMIDINFKDLSYQVRTGFLGRKQKQILKGLSGCFRSNELSAIMGPSGAGKSTLLNILSGLQEEKYTGKVEYVTGGKNKKQKYYKKKLCYIQQTDNMHGLFTVHESMMITSYLKINRNISLQLRQMIINNILNMLNLSHTKETRVGRLSGGQKKRLGIALELINNPPLMFLDEPTTGLDSLASLQCVRILKAQAQAGRTIICTIHQPSAALYQMFDHIYLVVDGHCMYRSSPDNTISYFAQKGLQCPKYHNPADFMLEVVSKEHGDYNEQLIAAAKWYTEKKNEMRSTILSSNSSDIDYSQTMIMTPPTELMRFWVLLQRCAILAHRDHSIIHIKLILHFLVAVLLGLLYEHSGDDADKTISNLSYLMVSIVYLSYTSMIPAVLKFPLEIDILRKERFNNWYQLRTYYFAILICAISLQIIFASVYSFVTYFMSSQPLEFSRFSMFLMITVLINFIYEGLGMGLGATFSPINGTFIGCITLCAMLALSGFLALFKDMTNFMYYISYLNVMRYMFDGLVQSIYGNHREKIYCSTTYCHLRVPSMILKQFDLTKPMFLFDVFVLLGYIVIFWVLAYIFLKKRLSKIY